MITYVDTTLFTSPAQTLVNTVNTVGVMGKGIAKTFKTVYPDMFEEYKSLCERGELAVGRLLLYRTNHKWVLNFQTKRHWRQPSRLDDIDIGLQSFRQSYAEQGITSVAFPQLGCGNGGLDWEAQVRPLMERHLAALPIDVFVHIATGEPPDEDVIDQDMVTWWLHGDPPSLPFRRFRQDIAVAMASGRIDRRGASGTVDAVDWSDADLDIAYDPDDYLPLWRRLRSFGFLVPEDVEASLAMPAESIIELLCALPYVTRARVARVSSRIEYDVDSTRDMLDAPKAQGVRIVLPLFVEGRTVVTSSPDDEDDAPCRASRTTSQLALFSTR